ncbi:MAG: hypothetical protein KGI53_06220 [Nitrospirota bacterium]|nr:hypothetical protein [Nitrospirota bacterium]
MPKRPGTKTALTPTEREDLFYEFLAGEARSSLLTSIIQMGLPALLADRGPMTEQDIIDALALHPPARPQMAAPAPIREPARRSP